MSGSGILTSRHPVENIFKKNHVVPGALTSSTGLFRYRHLGLRLRAATNPKSLSQHVLRIFVRSFGPSRDLPSKPNTLFFGCVFRKSRSHASNPASIKPFGLSTTRHRCSWFQSRCLHPCFGGRVSRLPLRGQADLVSKHWEKTIQLGEF